MAGLHGHGIHRDPVMLTHSTVLNANKEGKLPPAGCWGHARAQGGIKADG